jgi:hypothetical protein
MLELLFALLLYAEPCQITETERQTQLELDWHAFDQGSAGFRTFVSGERYCPLIAGKLIEDYLDVHPELSVKQRYVSEFHAGQQFAGLNDIPRALEHFYRGFNPHEDPAGDGKWNAYVRATIAFLEKDRDTLEASLKILERHQDNRMNAINVRLVRGFIAAFDKPYNEAINAAFKKGE